jgi:serine/threonine-protein kinase
MHGGRVSWVCVLILLYPSIAPTTLRKTLLASLAAASMEVVNFIVADARGVLQADATPIELAWTLATPYVCALMAIIPMQVIRKLGRQVTKARELGSYRLEERIGRGGMGEVFRASHRLLARPAAIKLIRPEVLGASTPDAARAIIGRFRREADAAASLRSPNTIELYDFGMSDDGTLFYVMELLEGVDLETLVERFGPVPVERAVQVLRQVSASLAEAHSRGLVHRDIKPSNIFVCRLGLDVDFVKVLDFGLVKREDSDGRDTVMLSSPDATSGTPAFMAPENATDQSKVGRPVDVYAFGCVAYWLVTGKLVFEAETAVQMMIKHVQEKPKPPSRLAQHIPAEFDALVMACLAKEPGARPPDAADLARRLAAVPLREPWSEARARAWWEEKRPETIPARSSRRATQNATIAHAGLSDSAS